MLLLDVWKWALRQVKDVYKRQVEDLYVEHTKAAIDSLGTADTAEETTDDTAEAADDTTDGAEEVTDDRCV